MKVDIIRQGTSKPSVDKIPELEKLMLPISDIFTPKEKVNGKGLYLKHFLIFTFSVFIEKAFYLRCLNLYLHIGYNRFAQGILKLTFRKTFCYILNLLFIDLACYNQTRSLHKRWFFVL